ncbi:MAG: thiamine-phosphate kinase, partial [Methanosarcinales archaeon]|nr:thiamine-phosphate kinase [Methanosarcinales archaeon]
GDLVCVCKTLGGADATLKLLGLGTEMQSESCIANSMIPDNLLAALYRPAPCVFEGIALAKTGVITSMMDISDGLSLSLKQLSDASHVGFEIEQSAIPIHPDAESILGYDEALECALYGGGDFGLLFTIKAEGVDVARKACPEMHIIGRVLEYGEIALKHNDKCTHFGEKGYEHFKTRA